MRSTKRTKPEAKHPKRSGKHSTQKVPRVIDKDIADAVGLLFKEAGGALPIFSAISDNIKNPKNFKQLSTFVSLNNFFLRLILLTE